MIQIALLFAAFVALLVLVGVIGTIVSRYAQSNLVLKHPPETLPPPPPEAAYLVSDYSEWFAGAGPFPQYDVCCAVPPINDDESTLDMEDD